jgi:hypothetical protein
MRTFKILTLLIALLIASGAMAEPLHWTPATFRSLKMGSSHKSDAIRVLGNPDSSRSTPQGEELSYRAKGDHKGDLTVRLDRTGLITEIEEAFPVAIPRTEVYKELGKIAVTSHFSIARCASGALYRDPKGGIELTLFPSRGIAIWPDQYGYDFAALHYLARQPGLLRAPACVSQH